MAAGDIYRVTAQWQSTSGDIFQWVWHYIQATGADKDTADILTGINTILEAAWANIASAIHTSIEGDTIELAKWDSGNQQFDTIDTLAMDSDLDGTGTSDPLPYQDAPVALFFTNVGRSLGKKFLFGIHETAQTGQTLSATVAANVALFAADLAASFLIGGDNFSPGNWNVVTELFRSWTGTVAANLLIGTQDRRRRGIGI